MRHGILAHPAIVHHPIEEALHRRKIVVAGLYFQAGLPSFCDVPLYSGCLHIRGQSKLAAAEYCLNSIVSEPGVAFGVPFVKQGLPEVVQMLRKRPAPVLPGFISGICIAQMGPVRKRAPPPRRGLSDLVLF
jgi:hypothetical protein